MVPYFLLLIVPLLFQIILKHTGKQIYIGNKKLTDGNSVALPIFFFLFLLLLAFRKESIGRDLGNYKIIFYSIGKSEFLADSLISEPVYRVYNWVIYNFVSSNYQVFLAITAVLSVIPIAIVYNRDQSYGYLKSAIFVNMSTFIMLFSGIRQGLAMAIGMLAYLALTKGKKIQFILFAVIASLTHHSGFMVFLFYPLWHFRFKKKDLWWIIPCVLFVIAFNTQIFNFLSVFMASQSDSYGVLAGSTGAIGSFLLFLLFSVFSFFISDEKRMDDEAFALRNILIFATVIQSFASLNSLAMRLNYYFILLIPIAVGKSINNSKPEYIQIARLADIVICAFFTILFFVSTYNSYKSGISTLDTIPYVPFWKG